MGRREKVALGFLIVVFMQITFRQCMARNVNKMPVQANRKLQRIAMYKPNTGNPLKPTKFTNNKPNKPKNKYSMNLINKLVKESQSKTEDNLKADVEPVSKLSKAFTPAPQPFCFQDFGTFPEVEYPMFITDTWGRNYWNQFPDLQQKKPKAVEKTEPTNYIKPSDKSIDKAIRTLVKLRNKSNKEIQTAVNPIISKSVSSFDNKDNDVCPLDSPNQCSPTEQPNAWNSTKETLYTPSTVAPMTEKYTNQLPFPTAVTPEYVNEVIPTSTTAMPLTGTSSLVTNLSNSDNTSTDTGLITEPGAVTPITEAMAPETVSGTPATGTPASATKPATEVLTPEQRTDTKSTGSTAEVLVPTTETLTPTNEVSASTKTLPLEVISDELPMDNILGLNDYEFATVAPDEVSFDTTEKNINPDDPTSELSPGDTDYIWE